MLLFGGSLYDMDPRSAESEQFFEPLGRCRSFTWHGNLNKYGVRDSTAKAGSPEVVIKNEVVPDGGGHKEDVLNLKKPSTRRNAWGCMSYADLITKAIESVPEKRLTLSQIYGWMIQNVPYFKDKGESNSSAGWKNSIRHNLSLHRKFIRVQNEGTGKSSWWMVNNDVKTCKSPRRRASSMDNKMCEKKRHRQATLMTRIEERNSAGDYTPPSNVALSSSEVHKLDSFATAFSPVDLRVNGRTSGLSSSHLTPIEPVAESAFDTNEVMTQPSPLYWNQCHSVNPPYGHSGESLTETVGESLVELFTPDVSASYERAFSPEHRLTLLQNVNEKYVSESGYGPFPDLGSGTLPSPPPYVSHPGEQHSDGLYSQVGAETCPKEFLQRSPVSSPLSDSFAAAAAPPYGTRSGYGQVQSLPRDAAAMQYYAERITEGYASRGDDSSVLRRMLMQNQPKNALQPRFGDVTSEPVVVKSEPANCDSFAYPETHTTLLCSGVTPGNSTQFDSTVDCQVGSSVEMEYGANMKHFDLENADRVIKTENCGDDSWEFNMTSIPNSAIANVSEN